MPPAGSTPAGDEYIYNGPICTARRRRTTTRSTRRTCGAGSRRSPSPLGAPVPVHAADDVEERRVHDDHGGRRLRPVGPGSGRVGRRRTDRFCNMFQPGYLPNPGVTPEYVQYTPRRKGYNTDLNNIGPIVGVAWRPNVQNGWLRDDPGRSRNSRRSTAATRAASSGRVWTSS